MIGNQLLPHRRRSGFALIAVLVVLAMLAYGGYALVRSMREEAQAATRESSGRQCRLLADSGIPVVDALHRLDQMGVTTPLEDPLAELWRNITIRLDLAAADGATTTTDNLPVGWLSILSPPSPAMESEPGRSPDLFPATGLEIEGGRIHLNYWGTHNPELLMDVLLGLPNATPELVDAVLDWLDPDSIERPNGAENDYYQGLPVPILPRNGPIGSLDELLLVRGMTADILYGDDHNRNGRSDLEESLAQSNSSPQAQGERTPGWADFLTLDSVEPNVDAQGQPRIFLNDPDLGRLYSLTQREFGDDLAKFVLAYRLFGSLGAIPVFFPDTTNTGPATQQSLNRYHFRTPAELIGGNVIGTWNEQTVTFASPITLDMVDAEREFARVLDRFTTNALPVTVGRLDLRAANRVTIRLLNMLTEEEQSAILENRPSFEDTISDGLAGRLPSSTDASSVQPRTLAWLLTSNVLTRDQLIAIEPLATVRSSVIRFQSLGFLNRGRQSARMEVVANRPPGPLEILRVMPLDAWGTVVPLDLLGQGGEPTDLPNLGVLGTR